MMNIMRKTTNSGSALHILLLAIVLFAAVSAVVTQSGKGGSDILRPEKAKLAAGELINYANQLSQAVRKVMLVNDCTDSQISFERAPFDGSDLSYRNTQAPLDKRCHIFNQNGGGVAFRLPPEAALDKSRNDQTDYGAFIITGNTSVKNLGSDCASSACNELVLFLPHINAETCKEINRKTGLSNYQTAIIDDNFVGVQYFRSSTTLYRYNADSEIYDSAGEVLVGRKFACIDSNHNPGGSGVHFYAVLLAR